jgi:predicted ABC-type ATPase
MTEDEEKVIEETVATARRMKRQIAEEFCNRTIYPPDSAPVSVFMAGSPGAGKTESSQNLITETAKGHPILRIDPDEFRRKFSNYSGTNSHLFQAATSILADYVHDCALENLQSFVFDGTFSNLEKARQNIERSLKRDRFVQILYVYQDPLQAWEFVKARERRDGRNVPIDSFIRQYFQARENVNLLKREFGKKIKVDLVIKNIDGTDFDYKENIDQIDSYIPERYSEDKLRKVIHE